MVSLARLALILTISVVSHSARSQTPPPAATGPQRWEKDIAAFEAADKQTPPPQSPVIFVGSSSIRMWSLPESFPDRPTLNRGFGGSTLADSIHYFDRLIIPHQPSAIVVYAGDNDIAKEMSAEEVAADFQKLAGLASEKLPGTPVIFIAIKPSIKRWNLWPAMSRANSLIASWCASRPGVHFADIAAPMLADVEAGQPPRASLFKKDGLHLSEEGYAVWTRVIEPMLARVLNKN